MKAIVDNSFEETVNDEIQEESDSTEQETEPEESSENEAVKPLISQEEYDALNKINEDLLEENKKPAERVKATPMALTIILNLPILSGSLLAK